MFVDEKIEVVINPSNVKHYESLGYVIPREIRENGQMQISWKSKIIVNINDLPKNSSVRVSVYCDICSENNEETIVTKSYQNVMRNRKNSNGLDICSNCNHKLIGKLMAKKRFNIDGEYVYNFFISKGLTPLFKSEDYERSSQLLPYRCKIHPEEIQYISYVTLELSIYGCFICAKESASKKMSIIMKEKYKNKENHPSWKGGITSLSHNIRESNSEWKQKSLYFYNYKCAITGISNGLVIHHLHSFDLIFQEILELADVKIYDNIGQYTTEELDKLKVICKDLHEKYGLGVVVNKKIHKLFHKLYGRGKNTHYQFDEFKQRLKSGEFNEFLNNNNLELVI